MRLALASADDAIDLRNYLRRFGFITFVDENDETVVHAAGSADSHKELRLVLTRAVGEWERRSLQSVDILDLF
jgi:hypothetical protein